MALTAKLRKENPALTPSEAAGVRRLSDKITERELMRGLSGKTSQDLLDSWNNGDPEATIRGLIARIVLLESKVERWEKKFENKS